ncbi:MAG TPA: cupin domain-containing protein [Candidatus Altiarchaeales archaeon]|nr:cupin domain-containing protein [Candidatus Altiarchaeales archaeon]
MDVKTPEIIEKPWGRELHFALEDEYIGKILEVKKGARLSLQYHEKKKETMCVLEGKMLFTLKNQTQELSVGACITIQPGEKHRVEAITDLKILEVSTPEPDDIIRIEDDHDRI